MMKKRGLSKRILAFVLSFMMVIVLVPMNAITVKAEGVPDCPHCGGTGVVCVNHDGLEHGGTGYSNESSCGSACKAYMNVCASHGGPLSYECDYCKRVIGACKHSFISSSVSYLANADYHWKKTCGGCGKIIDKGSHTDTNNDGICDTCRYSYSNGAILPGNNDDEFNLTIYNIPSEGGSTYCETRLISYSWGTSATFTAKPNPGYRFKGWYAMKSSNASGELGTCLSSEETYTITPSDVDTYKTCDSELSSKKTYSVYIAAVYEDSTVHTHSKGTPHAKVDATCNETGTLEYWECSGCDKNINDSLEEIGDITIPATGIHDFLDEGSANYNGEKCSLCNVKNIAYPDLDIKAISTTYNDAVQTAVITGIEAENYTVTGNTATNAGKYTITLTGKGDYTGTREVEWTIMKATPMVDPPPTPTETKYSGECVALLNPGTTDFGKLLYRTLEEESFSETIPCVEEPGDYLVYYMVEGGENWEEYVPPEPILVTVELAPQCTITGNHDFLDQDGISDPNIEACASCRVKNINFSGLDSSVGAVDKEYTGSGINPEVTITGLTQDTDYTVEDVTKTEPGEYEIKVTGKGDYAGERIVSWKIIPGEPTLIIPTPVAQYKQKLSDVEIVNPEGNVEGTWSWKKPDEVVTAIGESTFVAIFTPADTTKWNVVEKDIIVNVNKASYAPSEEYSKSFIYSGEYIDEIIDLSQFVAEDAGKASYAIADKTFTGTDTVTEAVIDGNNLKFSLAKMDAYAENTSTTISVTVSTANYQDYTKIIKITRSNCDHPEDMIVLEHVILPGCETTGEDIKKCTKCKEVIESGIVVQALGHDYIDGVCSRCGVISLELCKDINVDVTSVLYNETAQTPEVKVTYKGTELVEGTDYVLSVDSEAVIGTYELIIEGTGDYRDTIKKNWSVLPAKGLYCAAIPDQVYTGKAIKPKMDVYSDGVLLTVGKDYTITYGKYNTNVATKDAVSKGKNVAPSVTITGKGNYSDKKVLTFNIVPCSIDTAAVNNIVVAKTKSAIKINPVVTFDGKKLKLGTDYVVSTTTSADDAVTSYTEANVYNLYVVGKNNYSGAIPFTFTITGKTLANKVTVAKIENQKYDGGNQVKPVPSITYKIGGKSTDVSSHFDVTYDNNTEIGTATVTITAKDSSEMFAGSKTITFKIVGKSIAGAKLGTDGKEKIPVAVYNGNAYEPELNLYVGDDKLTKNVDYIVTYTKNVNNGTATATVVGKGKYTGSKKFTYKISKYDATTDSSSLIKVNGADACVVDISVNYEKGGVLPKPVVTFGGNELKEKADYTLSYANNKAVAAKDAMKSGKSIAPTMTITFKGNLSGKKTVKFTITNKDIKEGKITVADKAVSTKANAWKQTVVTIVDTNGKKLVAGTDYSKTFGYYSDPDCINEITADTLVADTPVYVKVYGIKNYDGTSIVGSYRISKNNLSKVSASIDPQTYTGKEICPEASDIKVWVGSGKTKTYLSAGKDYIVVSGSYTKNTNKGTATVAIIGKGDYYGTKVVKYTIGAKKFLWWEL